MNLRNQARSFLMHSASLIRADEVALRLFDKGRSAGVVVGVHETPRSMETEFRRQLEWVSRYFTITSLEGFATLWNTPRACDVRDKPLILFTFDDGRASNYAVAAPLLESFGGRGVFFVVPTFAECAANEALTFYRSRINPNSRPGDECWEDWEPMNPGQISDLAYRGHAIGNHTLTHQRLLGLSPDKLEYEIGEAARKVESWTNKPVDAFAWTFGWDSIDTTAWKAVQRHHRFCFSPCAGAINVRSDVPGLVWRREIEVKYSPEEYRFLYSGLADPWWSSRRRRLRKMLEISIASATN
jgi:peptidoglycan/xylan/chitin deacetylase (PgdA/CDA1 family)